jgi:hypothetical protein
MRNKFNVAFLNQRKRAKQRGIEFHFTFEEWKLWWEDNLGSDWFKLRGKRVGQYVMARNGDKGPYEASNVKCITAIKNIQECVKCHRHGRPNGTGGPIGSRILTSEDIKFIFYSRNLQKDIAKKYGISGRLVRLTKSKKCYKSIVADL